MTFVENRTRLPDVQIKSEKSVSGCGMGSAACNRRVTFGA
jgi:hypothetical protein